MLKFLAITTILNISSMFFLTMFLLIPACPTKHKHVVQEQSIYGISYALLLSQYIL